MFLFIDYVLPIHFMSIAIREHAYKWEATRNNISVGMYIIDDIKWQLSDG